MVKVTISKKSQGNIIISNSKFKVCDNRTSSGFVFAFISVRELNHLGLKSNYNYSVTVTVLERNPCPATCTLSVSL